jgi:ATP-dependent protease ClpP protease subunit
MPTTYINFHGPINQHTTQNLMSAISQRLMSGFDDFHILISTDGGDVASGLTLYNFLRAVAAPVTMHNVGALDSIGTAVFLAAETRLACPHSAFTFRSIGIELKDTRINERRARELLDSLLADQDRIVDIIVERTKIGRSKARQLLRDAKPRESNSAREVGMVHHIVAPAIRAGADIVSLVFKA